MSEFNLMFYNARWYDPALGRFIQADMIVPGGVQGLDRYAYVYNNPLNYTDPTGHFCTKVGPNTICSADVDSLGWWATSVTVGLTSEGQNLVEFVERSRGKYTIDEVIQMGFVGELTSWYKNDKVVDYDIELVGVRYQWYRINMCGGIDSWICKVNFATTFQSVNNVVNGYWNRVEQAIIDYRGNVDLWNAAGKMLNAILYPNPEYSDFNSKPIPDRLPNNWNLAFDLSIISRDDFIAKVGNRKPTMGVNGDFLYFEEVIYEGVVSYSAILTVSQWIFWGSK